MSAGRDNVFTRWSRLKQAARYSSTAGPQNDQLAPEAPADTGEQLAPAIVEPEAAEPAELLPRVEDLTAQSDLSAFLRKGVPKMLKRAALRKMWSLDPAIRDHIGPSDYAWDFNSPGSMAGFGPLKASSEPVVDFLSSGGNPTDPAPAAMASEAPETAPAASAVLAEEDVNASADGSDSVTPDSSIEPAPPPSPSADVAGTAADRDEAAGAAESSPIDRQRRHGGAMPR
ncbi:DUF3306 domain-containing protein [Mesorhizobium sp.]|uniref:DUF3306 domain-containing protein n=1 Tax=Mesorhizobium sp. TaxID=1871066 RepID=UPI000FE930E6|nr:DUF3306 domain-containing protein [Mesorhizobium sp.]RWK41216.1 MAG: DUF3306 domain-containing protein [Mesorhizobium sp.]RWK68114.1 MAG: DUF3306 domain-containing protein [Mesorhizobium sp.]RWK78329.1 MAG: DUF3306 domain-containing protein [Mesorhizobium sp.]RWK78898.1 MAG: DUF3306 domain-containing protein [Mesorhizobium sp.]RWL04097.1 MAG: DUF3306 domain-containing protein [Mesorhizobium sp.]